MTWIEGIGGAFIFSNDPARLAGWYTEHLGLCFEGSAEHGTFYQVFWGLDPEDRQRKLDTTFSIMQARVPLSNSASEPESDTMYGDQSFMVNLRVRDLEALVDHLALGGVRPLKRQDEPYGRFAWVRDCDGNRIELYQPLPAVDQPSPPPDDSDR